MRFVTSINRDKLCELIDNSLLFNNNVFDTSNISGIDLSSLLKDLNGCFSSIVSGLFIPESYGPLSTIWKEISKLLPIKVGDAIIQFNINSDECLFYKFNNFTSCIYQNTDSLVDSCELEPSPFCIVISDSVEISNFDCAYVVNTNWNKDNFNSSIGESSFTSILDLNASKIWEVMI